MTDNNNNNNSNDTILHIPVTAIKEDNQYSSLLFPTDEKEYEALKKDIAENGIKVPLIINSNNILLDGYTRLRIAKELQLDTVPCIIKSFNDRLGEELFILTVNFYRRHLNTAQKGEIVLKIIEKEQELSKQKSLMNLKQYKDKSEDKDKDKENKTYADDNHSDVNNSKDDIASDTESFPGNDSGDVRERIAKKFKISVKTISKIKKIKEVSSEDPKIAELWNEALQGKRSIQAVYDRVKQKEARDNVKPMVEDAKMKLELKYTDKVTILHGDFRTVSTGIPDDSIDLIFTDPPYNKDFIPYLNDLALLASRLLKPSGFIAVMYGQAFLPELFDAFKVNKIRYYWMIALHMPDSKEIFYTKRIRIHWKPIVVFQKEPYVNVSVELDDYISMPKPNKDVHEWKQDLGSAMHVIRALTKEGDVVLDPMVGSGTTIEAALMLNRRVIAIEKDKELYDMLLKRYYCE